MDTSDILIIGAGPAGLMAGRAGLEAGKTVQVLEAGYVPGGRLQSSRLATTCGADLSFDHGAQFVTFASDIGKDIAGQALAAGVLRLPEQPFSKLTGGIWADAPEDGDRPRMLGTPDMPAFAAWLAMSLDIMPGVKIVRADKTDDGWEVFDSRDRCWRGRGLVLAMPPKDQPPLSGLSGDSLFYQPTSSALRPCWAVHLGFEDDVPLVTPRAFVAGNDVIGFLARQQDRRPSEKAGRCRIMLHSSHDYAEDKGPDYPSNAVIGDMLAALSGLLGRELPAIGFSSAHFWRDAFVETPLGRDCLMDPANQLAACGDWCLGPRIEAAMLSGVAAGRAMAGLPG